jgi:1-phosphatidylinositol phosphodiesterase
MRRIVLVAVFFPLTFTLTTLYLMKTSLFNLFSLAHLSLIPQYNGYNSKYSFDADHLHEPQWMAAVPDNTYLTDLSIPGTHDTMTSAVVGPVYQCQNHHLATQLESGLRYFDIRARLNTNELLIYHQDQYTQYSYAEVLTTFFSFLESNPGETILMRLKEESTPINSTIDFLTAFNHYRLNSTITSSGFQKHVWLPPIPGPTSVPTLGELRSKVLILQNFGSDPAEYGIKWESPLLSIEDDYDIPDLYTGLDEKFESVKEGLLNAANGTEVGDGKLYLSHLSASVGVLPIEAAAGMKNGTVVGINDRIGMWLKDENNIGKGKTGVVIIDFPGKELIREVLGRN